MGVHPFESMLLKANQKDTEKRAAIINAVANHLVAHGFKDSGLRALAKSAGTSDRMVMYYFATKEELISEALAKLAADLASSLEAVIPEPRASKKHIFETMMTTSRSETIRPVLMLWFEIVGLGIRENGPYKQTANQILDDWESWIRLKLGSAKAHQAPDLLAQIEGALMISLIRTSDP